MKNFRLILLCCLVQLVCAQKSPVLSWSSHIKFGKIIYPGTKHVFVQKCVPGIDSVVSNGQIEFLNASLANIEKCRMMYTVKDTVFLLCELSVAGKTAIKQLDIFLNQLIPNYNGPFINSSMDGTDYKSWISDIGGIRYFIKYQSRSKKKRAAVTIIPMAVN